MLNKNINRVKVSGWGGNHKKSSLTVVQDNTIQGIEKYEEVEACFRAKWHEVAKNRSVKKSKGRSKFSKKWL